MFIEVSERKFFTEKQKAFANQYKGFSKLKQIMMKKHYLLQM